MKKRLAALLGVLALTTALSGCYTMTHTVGRGAQGSGERSHRDWYALWGLVPLSETDSQDLAGGAADYTVQTQWSITDILINLFTTWVTIQSRTITVTK